MSSRNRFKQTRPLIPGRATSPPSAEARVRSEVNPCAIFGGHSGTGPAGIFPSTFVSPVNITPPMLHTRVYAPVTNTKKNSATDSVVKYAFRRSENHMR